MPWNNNLTHLRDWFADRYYTVEQSRRIVVEAGLKPALISFNDQPVTNWFNILDHAMNQQAVDAVIDVAQTEYPTAKEWLEAAKAGILTGISGTDIKTDIAWNGADDPDKLEKIIGTRNALMPIHFLELGMTRARSVIRIELPDGSSGSGFLTAGNLLVTNNHVIPNREVALQARVQCNFQLTAALLNAQKDEYKLDPDNGFATSPKEKHDWTAVRVQGDPNAKWGALPLASVSPAKDDWVNIIQHPAGGPKQIALYDNLIVYVDENRVQYLTDTLPGSSGSPCFDSNWNVIALHHSGGWLREPNSKERHYRNEGIHINRVIEGLVAAGLMST
ncbi:MAG: trypsin-like peptidase domain-containing protein [Caldilineaceae bacterium]|nr:trypsin-like peptidase domain-containing protein [Caldilineaceae bacterium]